MTDLAFLCLGLLLGIIVGGLLSIVLLGDYIKKDNRT